MRLDVVVPFFNEEQCARSFVESLLNAVSGIRDTEVRLIAVDDGSSDRTAEILDDLSHRDTRIVVVHLWGNHGHQRALVAGLDRCEGDMALMLDGDGQHPVETAVELVAQLRRSPQLSIAQALRRGSQGGRVKNAASTFFYWTLNKIMSDAMLRPGASDFRVLRKSVVQLLRSYPDRHRNLRVLLASLKLPTTYVEYDVAPRIAGVSRYRFGQMLALALDGWFAFSSSPLRISLFMMCGSGIVGLAYVIYGLSMYLLSRTVPGWMSTVALIFFFFSAVFGVLAVMSEYIARIYSDVRGHPVYRLSPDAERAPVPEETTRDNDRGEINKEGSGR